MKQLVLIILVFVQTNVFPSNYIGSFGGYCLIRNHIVVAKVIRSNKYFIKIHIEQWLKDKTKVKRSKLRVWKSYSYNKFVKDSSFVFILGGHNNNTNKFKVRNKRSFLVDGSLVRIHRDLLIKYKFKDEFIYENNYFSYPIDKCIELIKLINKTFIYDADLKRYFYNECLFKLDDFSEVIISDLKSRYIDN